MEEKKKKNWKSVTEERGETRMRRRRRGCKNVSERMTGVEMKELGPHNSVIDQCKVAHGGSWNSGLQLSHPCLLPPNNV